MNKKKLLRVITLTEKEEQAMKNEIAAYYHDVRDEEIGIIGQEQIFDLLNTMQ